MMAAMQRVALHVPGLGLVDTAFVGPAASASAAAAAADSGAPRPAFVLLHGFDSSCLEFRRFHPLLSQLGDVYAVDLAGWGFTDAGFGGADAAQRVLGPAQKRAHLAAFMEAVVGRPATLVGTSLGGTVAIDYALHHPRDVQRLVLVDAQVCVCAGAHLCVSVLHLCVPAAGTALCVCVGGGGVPESLNFAALLLPV